MFASGEPPAELDQESFQSWYGRVEPLAPPEVAELLDGSGVRWAIAGGQAARLGAATSRRHEDVDIEVPAGELQCLRQHLSGWHLWQVDDGSLRPWLPPDELRPAVHQLWLRRDSTHPWVADILVQPGTHDWVYRRDPRVRLPWAKAHHVVHGVTYVRPEVALLFKARHDRAKDRADLAAAQLSSAGRAWLVSTFEALGHVEWAKLASRVAQAETSG